MPCILDSWQQGTTALSTLFTDPVLHQSMLTSVILVPCATGLSSWSSSVAVYNKVLRRRPDLAEVCSNWDCSSQLQHYCCTLVDERCDGGSWNRLRLAGIGMLIKSAITLLNNSGQREAVPTVRGALPAASPGFRCAGIGVAA